MLSALQTAYKLQSHHEIDIYLIHISLLDYFFEYNHFILSYLQVIHKTWGLLFQLKLVFFFFFNFSQDLTDVFKMFI